MNLKKLKFPRNSRFTENILAADEIQETRSTLYGMDSGQHSMVFKAHDKLGSIKRSVELIFDQIERRARIRLRYLWNALIIYDTPSRPDTSANQCLQLLDRIRRVSRSLNSVACTWSPSYLVDCRDYKAIYPWRIVIRSCLM